MHFKSKLPDVGTTIFTVMSRRAAEENALNIGQGFPDYPIAPRLAAALNEVIAEGRNQYAPMEGTIELREQICKKLASCYQHQFDPHTDITVTCGGTESLYDAIQAAIGPGAHLPLEFADGRVGATADSDRPPVARAAKPVVSEIRESREAAKPAAPKRVAKAVDQGSLF